MINYGLAQISRAYGQRAKSPMRAVAALLARVKIYCNPQPYGLDSLWFGSIVAWINCGLDQLWLGSNLTSLRPEGQVANARGRCAPRAFKELLHPTPLWLGFIVAWVHCGLVPLNLFNYIHVKYYFAEFYTCSVIRLFTYLFGECTFCSLKIDQLLFVQILNSSIIKLVS